MRNYKEILERVELVRAPLSRKIYLIIPSKTEPGTALCKKDITEAFSKFINDNKDLEELISDNS